MSKRQNEGPKTLYGKGLVAFDKLKKREQTLLFFGLPIAMCVAVFLLYIEPEIKKMSQLSTTLPSLKNQLEITRLSNNELLAQAEIDPNVHIGEQIDALKARLNGLNREFEGELSQLVSPKAMPVLLEQLFEQADDLKLLNMKSVPPEVLLVKSSSNAKNENGEVLQDPNNFRSNVTNEESPIYRHGIEITFEGSFFATRDFLANAENLGWKLYWQDLSYSVGEHPLATTSLTLFTLSTSEAFIGVY